MIGLIDYGAGNVRSLHNAIHALGYTPAVIAQPEDILRAERLIFPGVGNFGAVMARLHELGFYQPLLEYLHADRPFLGICVGMQALFEGSSEAPEVRGLGLIPGQVTRFPCHRYPVPHMGWNGIRQLKESPLLSGCQRHDFYFVHSYCALPRETNTDWQLALTDYDEAFLSAVEYGQIAGIQFHPEKSGEAGLRLLRNFLAADQQPELVAAARPTDLSKRIIACLDVRANDAGDLVVTKGDQYDVRSDGEVRNLGKPVELAKRYYEEGADEITFLNITGYRDFPLADQPMLEVLRQTSEQVFVPLTIGGGIRDFVDHHGRQYRAVDIATEYFRSGADKISIGSDAVYLAEQVLAANGAAPGNSAIEQISELYGRQAVVVSIDARRVYVSHPDETDHEVIETQELGPNGEKWCWFQCTVKGGREGRDIDVTQLVRICEQLGAGELLVNSIDRDGTGKGFDLELIQMVHDIVHIPVIASSGVGKVEHFAEVFSRTNVEAALAAGVFHRQEIAINTVKEDLAGQGMPVRE